MNLHALDSVVVRPAVAADAAVIARIHGDAYEFTYGLKGDALAEARAEREGRWPRILSGETPPVTVLVAVVDDQVVAFAASYPVRDDWSWEHLASLYAAREVQGTGIASVLMRELADRLGAVGRRKLRALVLSENARARAFYARLGAIEVREQEDELAGRPVIDIVLEWPRMADLARAARADLDRRLAPPAALGWREAAAQQGAPHPAGVADEAKQRAKRRLGEPFGLSQYGVNRLELGPGVHSAPAHAHSHEDEFLMVLEGSVWLISGSEERALGPGDCAGFPAGTGRPHHVENRSDRPAVLLEVGSRLPDRDEVEYGNDDLRVVQAPDGRRLFTKRDGTVIGPG